MSSNEKTISFEQLPSAVATLLHELRELKELVRNSQMHASPPADRWLSLQELCNYLPDHPARQTVYGWVNQRFIPYHKKGKKLQFLQSEIDAWLKTDRRLTAAELQAQAQQYINAKRGGAL